MTRTADAGLTWTFAIASEAARPNLIPHPPTPRSAGEGLFKSSGKGPRTWSGRRCAPTSVLKDFRGLFFVLPCGSELDSGYENESEVPITVFQTASGAFSGVS
jgi:hypothetical protein